MKVLRERTATFLVVVVLAGAACGSGAGTSERANVEEPASDTVDGGTQGTTPEPEGSPGAGGGAPIGAPSGGAIGSPIKIPALEQIGNPPSVIAAAVEPAVETQCGGSLCVDLRYIDQEGRGVSLDPDDPVANVCRWAPGRPGEVPLRADLEVARGSEVTFGFNCDNDGETSGEGGSAGETGEGDGGHGETGDSTGTSDPPIEDEPPAVEQ